MAFSTQPSALSPADLAESRLLTAECFDMASMYFYLVRHGEARSEAEAPGRPLSDQGRRDVERVARALAAKGVCLSGILYSDKLRAKQTAEMISGFLSPPQGAREVGGLAPEDDPLIAKAELETAGDSMMLVGHLPHLGRLTSLLVAGDPERKIADFPAAGVVCLSYGAGSWKLAWTLTPENV
jgi:phosphohistidine phosphatase